MKDTKYMLSEAYQITKKVSGINPGNPAQFKEVLVDDNAFKTYCMALAESMDQNTKEEFMILAENTRKALLENSMYQLNPYETLVVPILSIFYPRLIARELVTVTPIDKPEVIKAFLKPSFKRWNDPNTYTAPSVNQDISIGPGLDVAAGASANVPGTTDILAVLGLTSDVAHLQKDFMIYRVEDGAGNHTDVQITPTVDGTISASVEIAGNPDTLLGQVDYLNGTVTLSSSNGVVARAYYTVTASLEENTINPKMYLDVEKIRIPVKDRQISAEWSIQMQQDLKALFDIEIQAELVTIIGQQIALDIDREIINQLFFAAENLAGASHSDAFSKTPPPTFTWGQKQWFENILPKIANLSAVIYNDTNIGEGNIIACNPVDAAIFESLNEFSYVGSGMEGGNLGYRSAVISGGRWKVVTSAIVPQGKMLLVYKPDVEMKVVYYYMPYVPAVLTPFPLGQKPSLTIISRYGQALIRPAGLAELQINP